MFYLPEFNGSVAHWILAVYLVSSPMFFVSEATGSMSFGYSKFADRKKARALPSRLGMFIIYFPAVFAFWLPAIGRDAPIPGWHALAGALMSAHFAKRCLEVLFVHRYSGVMNLGSVAMICTLYTTVSGLMGWIAFHEIDATVLSSGDFTPMLRLGLVVWGLGTAINFWHHRILANLRKPGETGYVMPKRGLFRFVACPHYLGEIIAWWGYSIVFCHVGAAIASLAMTFYLAGRAHNTVKWYRERLGDQVPKGWRRLVPFVY